MFCKFLLAFLLDNTVHIRPVQRTQTASVGDSVVVEMQNVNSPNSDFRWKRNGDDMAGWNDRLNVSIGSVAAADAGVYSCSVNGQENQRLHGIMRLIVRGL